MWELSTKFTLPTKSTAQPAAPAAQSTRADPNKKDDDKNKKSSKDPTGKKPRPVQSGNSRTMSQRAADALNKAFNKSLSKNEWGDALESLKDFNGIPNDVHGQIMDNGDFMVRGNTIDNIGNYVH